MADRLSTTTAALRAAGDRFAWAADDLDRILAGLVEGLSDLGDVAGDDEAGRAFAADHDAARDRTVRALRNLAACARSASTGLAAGAANLDDAERASSVLKAS